MASSFVFIPHSASNFFLINSRPQTPTSNKSKTTISKKDETLKSETEKHPKRKRRAVPMTTKEESEEPEVHI
jgi:hypothetical protein